MKFTPNGIHPFNLSIVKEASGFCNIRITLERVSLQLNLLVVIKSTVYAPVLVYVKNGLVRVEDVPSPNLHSYFFA